MALFSRSRVDGALPGLPEIRSIYVASGVGGRYSGDVARSMEKLGLGRERVEMGEEGHDQGRQV